MTSAVEAKNFVQRHLGSDQFRTYNVNIARTIGLEEAILLNDLIDTHKHLEENEQLFPLKKQKGVWFYYSSAKGEKRTSIKRKAMMRVVNSLKRKKLIIYVKAGVPAKRHFQLNFEAIYNISNSVSICPKRDTKMSQTGQLEVPNGTTINDPKYDPKKNSSRNSVTPSEQSFRQAKLLFEKIKENDPHVKPPDIGKWAAAFDRMHKYDNRSWEEIEALIIFSQEDEFWCTNILSPGKLRKQATQLTLRMKKGSKKGNGEKEVRLVDKNHDLAWDIVHQKRISLAQVHFFEKHVEVGGNGSNILLPFGNDGFAAQFDHALHYCGHL